ncbi:MAG: hypothetical protein E6J79_12175 [Deltaproteobacteria bacterium]|nr:MAG: hypothetical protein E6J79_12175 [Deltaproteobacteria bacterium]
MASVTPRKTAAIRAGRSTPTRRRRPLEGPYSPDASLGAARLNGATGHADAAREIYAQLLKESPDPDLRALLTSKLPPSGESTATAGR